MFGDVRTYILSRGIRTRLRRLGVVGESKGVRCDTRIVDVDGVYLRAGPHLHPVVNRRILEQRYNRTERSLIEPRLGSADVVLEFGVCLGHMAMACARKVGADRVIGFEANEAMRPIIEDHFELNGVCPRICYQAIASRNGDAVLHVTDNPQDSSLVGDVGTARVVRTTAISDVLPSVRPTVLIVDIEGGEADVLPSAELGGIRLLLVEMHPELIGARAVNRLRRAVRRQGFSETSPDGRNFLFSRSHRS